MMLLTSSQDHWPPPHHTPGKAEGIFLFSHPYHTTTSTDVSLSVDVSVWMCECGCVSVDVCMVGV